MQYQNQLLESQVEIHEQTLKNISEEIHDNIGQVLSLVKLNLNTFPNHLEAPVQKKIGETEELLGKAINDLRDLNQSMHGDKIRAIGLAASLEKELNIIKRTGEFETELQVEGNMYHLDQQKEVILFRIAQESLNNAIKHSHAKKIIIRLQYSPQSLLLIIQDNGRGFDMLQQDPTETGLGLRSMKNRAALSGANFVVHSSTGNGTTITVELKKATP